MNLIIYISKERYDEIMAMDWKNCRSLFDEEIRAIHDGRVIEEPCEDAISRQAVLNIVDSYSVSQSNIEDVTQDIISDIMVLPSVKHTKTCYKMCGRWERKMS